MKNIDIRLAIVNKRLKNYEVSCGLRSKRVYFLKMD